MMRNLIFFFLILLSPLSRAETSSYFQQGTKEFAVSNLGIGYASPGGFLVQATTRYQYYVWNRVSFGGLAFYNKFSSEEWMGLGPSASYIFLTYQNWFARFDQQVIAAKFNGFSEHPATLFGTSSVSVNYLPDASNFSLGLGYAHSYAFDSGRVLRPNALQLFVGWFFR